MPRISKPGPRRSPSFIEQARRRQIIHTAIGTIAEVGYEQASLAQIAKAAGVSKGVITYHFAGKDELIEQVITTILGEMSAFVLEQARQPESARAQMRAYINAQFEFMRSNREKFVTMLELWDSFGSKAEKRRFSATLYQPCRAHIDRIVAAGRKSGEFKAAPSRAFSAVLQGAIDGVMFQWVFDPTAIDLIESRDQLHAMVATYLQARPAQA